MKTTKTKRPRPILHGTQPKEDKMVYQFTKFPIPELACKIVVVPKTDPMERIHGVATQMYEGSFLRRQAEFPVIGSLLPYEVIHAILYALGHIPKGDPVVIEVEERIWAHIEHLVNHRAEKSWLKEDPAIDRFIVAIAAPNVSVSPSFHGYLIDKFPACERLADRAFKDALEMQKQNKSIEEEVLLRSIREGMN